MKKSVMESLVNDKVQELRDIIKQKCSDNKAAGEKEHKGTNRYKQQVDLCEVIKDLLNNIKSDDVQLSSGSQDKFNRFTSPVSEKVGGKRIIIEEGMSLIDLMISYPNLNLNKLNKKLEGTDLYLNEKTKVIEHK